ncbi:hypothetical protein AQUSIP_24690 [Aquicella siphonis]|uniref:Uncharacterized protein n=1 Tax=Aquicella siphonis TaxID=254247 RepID=A0A5E4PLK4_9COXI|nr:hypothetical protein [Aquicella siphonis]VVC77142.1 hypothetical protein AQUSIP_24690 [Aquicella siphonis]
MLRRKGSHSGSPSASFENNDTFFKKLLPLALEGKLAIQTKEIDENPSLIIRTAHSGLMADLESNINKYLQEPVKATHSESEHSIQLDQTMLDQVCAALRLEIQGRDLIAELEEFNQQNARKSIPQPVAGFELDFALAWPDLGRDSATPKSRKTTRASVSPIMRPLVTDSLTKAQSQFIHREEASRERTVVYDNRDFKAWYDINSIDHLFYLLPADDQRLPPYVIAEHDNANAYFLFQLAELKERFESSEAVIQTFTTKPETGSAHYYAGVISALMLQILIIFPCCCSILPAITRNLKESWKCWRAPRYSTAYTYQ